MKNILRTQLKITLFLSVVGLFATIAPSCRSATEPTPPEPEPEPTLVGYAEENVNHTHVIGSSPCPDPVYGTITVNCFTGTDSSACSIDSVVIEQTTPGLIAKFNTGSSTSFKSGLKSRKIDFTFTCAIAESFTQLYKLVFYKEGVKVTEEDFTVVVTVL
ncbi:MAG: hypothetical protein KJP21_07865 [Bacteroidia bacterium]|nr:hypothetical protein [Bacteroidia bacterium]NNJ55645.1 hypothetical protein [Bacteroidia bacterium]